MYFFDDKGGGVRKHPKHADVIYEWSLKHYHLTKIAYLSDDPSSNKKEMRKSAKTSHLLHRKERCNIIQLANLDWLSGGLKVD